MTVAEVQEVDVGQLKEWLDDENVLLVDVREKLEFEPEHLPEAQFFPISAFEPKTIPDPGGRRVVFYCQAGVRSYNAARRWLEAVDGSQEACSLKGGIAAWKEAGLRTRVDQRASAEVQRQVYIVVGTLVLAGTAAGYWMTPAALLLPALVSAGLLLAAMTGQCSLAILLSKLPWNR